MCYNIYMSKRVILPILVLVAIFGGLYVYEQYLKFPPPPGYHREISYPDKIKEADRVALGEAFGKTLATIDKDKHDKSAWMDLGALYNIIGDYQGARLSWEYAAILDPNSFVPLYNLGTLYLSDLKDYALSEKYFRQALVLDPSQIGVYQSLYDLYRYGLLDDTRAKAILEEGIEANPFASPNLKYLLEHYDEA